MVIRKRQVSVYRKMSWLFIGRPTVDFALQLTESRRIRITRNFSEHVLLVALFYRRYFTVLLL